jgi:hypothetical protein
MMQSSSTPQLHLQPDTITDRDRDRDIDTQSQTHDATPHFSDVYLDVAMNVLTEHGIETCPFEEIAQTLYAKRQPTHTRG